jgi:hypothetical protein
MLNIGDRVTVVDNGKTFDTYEKFVEKYASGYSHLFEREECPDEDDTVYTVVGIGKHISSPNFLGQLCVIANDDHAYVIGENGLKLEEEHMLNVGDTVKVIGQQVESMKSIGYIGKIVTVNGGCDRPYSLDNGYVYNEEELEVLPKAFTKDDLKENMLVQARNGQWAIINSLAKDDPNGGAMYPSGKYAPLDDYSDTLKAPDGYSEWNIMKVATFDYFGDFIRYVKGERDMEKAQGFKVIYDRSKEERRKELQEQLEKAQGELEALQ